MSGFKKMMSMLLFFGFISILSMPQTMRVSAANTGIQKKYALAARNVRNVQVRGNYLLISQKKNHVVLVDLLKKLKKKEADLYYKNRLISKSAKAYFPAFDDQIFIRDKQNKILYSGDRDSKCYSIFGHKEIYDCERDSAPVANQVVLKNITKCWCGDGMFAYVKNNNLVVSGSAVVFQDEYHYECYDVKSKYTFFKGKADQVKQVVSGNENIFVLMKDGSVWGRGSNEKKLISDSDKQYYEKFVKIVSAGVRSIAASFNSVGMLKKDGTLWLWGEKMVSGKLTYVTEPYKIAGNVTEFSLGWSNPRANTGSVVVAFLKNNGKAYGWGANDRYALTSKYKTGWIDKPVKLKSNIKHVYVGDNKTFLLDEKNRLYWAGTQGYTGNFDWMDKLVSQ